MMTMTMKMMIKLKKTTKMTWTKKKQKKIYFFVLDIYLSRLSNAVSQICHSDLPGNAHPNKDTCWLRRHRCNNNTLDNVLLSVLGVRLGFRV